MNLFLSEDMIDEALTLVELEDENFQRIQFEGNAPSDMLTLYKSSLCKGKAMLTLQLTHVAENPRTTAPKLQKALLEFVDLVIVLLQLTYYLNTIIYVLHVEYTICNVQIHIYMERTLGTLQKYYFL